MVSEPKVFHDKDLNSSNWNKHFNSWMFRVPGYLIFLRKYITNCIRYNINMCVYMYILKKCVYIYIYKYNMALYVCCKYINNIYIYVYLLIFCLYIELLVLWLEKSTDKCSRTLYTKNQNSNQNKDHLGSRYTYLPRNIWLFISKTKSPHPAALWTFTQHLSI